MDHSLPTINELGKDLLVVSPLLVCLSLIFPFMLTAGFFVFCASSWWLAAFMCPVLLSFFTYGSISHDLVHRTLRIPRFLNEWLLCTVELLALRSGHAYRASHLNHHAKFPSADDLEGAASAMTVFESLIDGLSLQLRIWIHAAQTNKSDRVWIYGEAIAVAALLTTSLAVIHWTIFPALYCGLMIGGSWIFPFITSWIPHNADGDSELTKTKLFRGNVIRLVSMDHLYHLEHHLYPQVPHHQWPELARRLDPHFKELNLPAIKLWF